MNPIAVVAADMPKDTFAAVAAAAVPIAAAVKMHISKSLQIQGTGVVQRRNRRVGL